MVGSDLVHLVHQFFSTGSLPTHLNDSTIVLIPKKQIPLSMGDVRPIALCNVSYKIISKVMSNRVQGVLHLIICLISDNIMVAHEV